ncbi:MAG: NfeD family protein [Deltaproteobacteria bacterium]|nr:NfeD family protein [Deltaproteobacteria bacterium]
MLLWVVKDAVLFPFVWRAYDRSQERSMQKMIGKKGVAKERLDPSGYIQVHGELWKAELMEGAPPVEEGEPVRVEGIRGRVLLVRGESKID